MPVLTGWFSNLKYEKVPVSISLFGNLFREKRCKILSGCWY